MSRTEGLPALRPGVTPSGNPVDAVPARRRRRARDGAIAALTSAALTTVVGCGGTSGSTAAARPAPALTTARTASASIAATTSAPPASASPAPLRTIGPSSTSSPSATAPPACTVPPAPARSGPPLSDGGAANVIGHLTKQLAPLVPQHGPPMLSGPAVREFGIDKVDAGYRLAVEVTRKAISDPVTLLSSHPTRSTVCYLLPHLSADGRQRLDDAFAGRGPQPGFKLYELFDRVGPSISGYALRAPYTGNLVVGVPGHVGTWITRGLPDRLDITVHLGKDLLVTKGGKPYRIPHNRDVRYFMVPSPSAPGGWLIDDWYAITRTGFPEVDPSG